MADPGDQTEQLDRALDIACATIPSLRVDSPRRLTGPGLLWARPGAVIDVFHNGPNPPPVTALWERHARRVLDAMGWNAEAVITRPFQGGVNLALSAPIDQLYSAIHAAQAAWHLCAADLTGTAEVPFDTIVANLKKFMKLEENPALIELIAAADRHGIDILCDDDEISIGHGTGSMTWPADALPAISAIDWAALHDVPIALITGTNGKTTTTRLCAAIVESDDKIAGLTSTDHVQVGRDIIEKGDFSGPAGGRMVLRDLRVEIAVLEVARGGILRRGLPTRRAKVAVVTNLAKDHLGEYGVNTLQDLAQAKFAVAHALDDTGVLVMNADDPLLVSEATSLDKPIWWFAISPQSPQIAKARATGRPCAYLDGQNLVFFDGMSEVLSIPVDTVPITLAGAAKHNVRNALAAICACRALGIATASIRLGLSKFKPDRTDNPGRLNEVSFNDARVFIDYAHNVHSILAVCDTLSAVPSARRFLMLSQPGDRSDQDIAGAMTAALNFRPDVTVISEIEDYLRGRQLGDTSKLLKHAAIAGGMKLEQIRFAPTPAAGTAMILEQIQANDLILLLVLSDREKVFALLAAE